MSADLDNDVYSLTDATDERTALWTILCFHAARLLFLISHGIFVIVVSSWLGNLADADWWTLFLPIWIGDTLAVVFLILSWCASCPYIKACMAERQPCLNESPSILTEVLPTIVTAILGVIFMVLVMCGEYQFCKYLDSLQKGHPQSLAPSMVLLIMGCMLAFCHGVLVTSNSALFVAAGGSLFVALIIFGSTGGGSPSYGVQVLILSPLLLAVIGLLLAGLSRLRYHRGALSREERRLRSAEIVGLTLLATCFSCLTVQVWHGGLAAVATSGKLVGLVLCALALIRARLCYLEAQRPLADRMFLAIIANSRADTAAPGPELGADVGGSAEATELEMPRCAVGPI